MLSFPSELCSFTEQVLAQFEVLRICSDQGGMARAFPAPTKVHPLPQTPQFQPLTFFTAFVRFFSKPPDSRGCKYFRKNSMRKCRNWDFYALEWDGPQAHERDVLILRGRGLTAQQIRAERSANVSFQKVAGCRVDPALPLEFRFPCSACFLPLPSLAALVASANLGLIFTWLRFDHRYVNQGPLCGRAAALKVSSSLFWGTPSLFLPLST